MSGTRRRRPAARTATRRRSTKAREFWGPDALDDERAAVITPSNHPTAMIESLGPPPFPGGQIAQLHFEVVYQRAAALAVALAASAGLVDVSDPSEDDHGDIDADVA
jgi:hypothetical protein